jgi:DNA mismatch repair protein MutL
VNRIRLLPEHVANQIAAGEVVERPASVVKELVENSLDAGATRLTVEIQAGGRSLIRVTDDGVGMSRDDALLSLERHATSKIRKAEDLYAISTMGFRGEAIPSIASVSRMTINSREREADTEEGTQIVIHGGKILEVRAAGCASGTVMEVRQLFFNLPARRKFLRSEETERAHIQHYLTLVALAHPHVAFTFIQDTRIVWQLPAVEITKERQTEAIHERFRALYGGGFEMLPLDFQAHFEAPPDPDGDLDMVPRKEPFTLWGLLGAPGVSRGTREDQHLFVNKRPVENRGLNHALFEGYHTMLMKGRYPVCCLFLEISPAAVDVNIHPSKREVKFHREMDVRRLVTQAVRAALLKYHQKSVSAPTAPELPTITPPEATLFTKYPEHTGSRSVEPTHARVESPAAAPQTRSLPNFIPALPQSPISNWPERPPRKEETPCTPGLNGSATQSVPPPGPTSAVQPLHSTGPVPLLEVPLRLLGVVGKLYVVLESDRGVVLLDQHAAHERVLFEQMLNRMEQGPAASQRLLLPHTIEVSPRDAQFLREQLETLTRLGVGLSEFGERTFLLDSLPPFVKAPDAKKFVIELVDALKAAGQEVNSWRLGEEMIAKTVCRHAVKANDPLSTPELENLVNDLRRCAMPYTCPHGRPTLIEMNFRELEKKFGRVQ